MLRKLLFVIIPLLSYAAADGRFAWRSGMTVTAPPELSTPRIAQSLDMARNVSVEFPSGQPVHIDYVQQTYPTQPPNTYRTTQPPNTYRTTQPPNTYRTTQPPNTYRTTQPPNQNGICGCNNPTTSRPQTTARTIPTTQRTTTQAPITTKAPCSCGCNGCNNTPTTRMPTTTARTIPTTQRTTTQAPTTAKPSCSCGCCNPTTHAPTTWWPQTTARTIPTTQPTTQRTTTQPPTTAKPSCSCGCCNPTTHAPTTWWPQTTARTIPTTQPTTVKPPCACGCCDAAKNWVQTTIRSYLSTTNSPYWNPETTQSPSGYVCGQRNSYYQLPNENNAYIECKDSVPTKKVCPNGLVFKPNTVWPAYPCNYPSYY